MLTRLEQVRLLDGMTDAYADALMALGLDTYYEIHRLRVDTLLEKLKSPLGDGIISDLPDTNTVVRWQKSAVRHSLTRMVDVKVRSGRLHTPLAGATIEAGDVTAETDETGTARLIGVSPAVRTICVSRDGFYDLDMKVDLRDEATGTLTFTLAESRSGGRSPIHYSEYDGYLLEVSEGDRQRVRDRELAEIPAGAILLATRVETDGATLVSMMRTRDGDIIYTDRAEAARTLLPSGLEEGALVAWDGETLTAHAANRKALDAERARRKFGFTSDLKWPRIVDDSTGPSLLNNPLTLPPTNLEDLDGDQRNALAQAVNDHPDGVPLSVFTAILQGS